MKGVFICRGRVDPGGWEQLLVRSLDGTGTDLHTYVSRQWVLDCFRGGGGSTNQLEE